MAFSFEKLEDRDLLTDLDIGFDGPSIVSVGDIVSYSYSVTNREQTRVELYPELHVALEDVQWTLGGQPWIATDDTKVGIESGETIDFDATGRVPSVEHFLVSIVMREADGSGRAGTVSVYVLDGFVDENTVGSEIFTSSRDQGFTVFTSLDNFAALKSEDFDNDGLHDIAVDFRGQTGEPYRHTVFGAQVVDRQLEDAFYARVNNSTAVTDVDESSRLRVDFDADVRHHEIGDIDGDGYDDIIRTEHRAASFSGTATILFGPDYRDNFVIFGSRFVGQPGGDAKFGVGAGPLGDMNGDGFNEYYVVDRFRGINVIYGRNFERNPTGDVNRDGTVDFNDFLILAKNFNRETNDRALGELDGDGRVTFLDFLLLAENFS